MKDIVLFLAVLFGFMLILNGSNQKKSTTLKQYQDQKRLDDIGVATHQAAEQVWPDHN